MLDHSTLPPTVSVQESVPSLASVSSPEQKKKHRLRRVWRGFWSLVDWLMGAAVLIVGLAILAVIPVLNFLSLGYLIEVSGRIARTGKMRAGFIGIRKASAVGSLVAGTWLVLLPVRLVSGMWKDAELIDQGSPTAKGWYIFLIMITVLAAIHIAWAAIRGGRLRHFLWPAPIQFFRWMGQDGKFTQVRNSVLNYIKALGLPYYLWLGFRGFVGAVIWLAVPVLILFGGAQIASTPLAAIVNLIGAGFLMIAVSYLPFMQAHFANEGQFRALFQVKKVRDVFRRAPIAFWLSLFATLLFALPLYILKIELPPQDLAWIPSVVFVVFIFPARLLVGWAFSRGLRREKKGHWIFRYASRFAMVPIVGAYAFIVWLTQYLTFNGTWSLLEQHAFLVPAPMLGL